MNIFIIMFALAIWGVVHSFLASQLAKDLFHLKSGSMDFYRLAYNLFAGISFLPVLYLAASLPDRSIYAVPFPWNMVLRLVQGFALVLLLITFLQTDWLSFVGLRQAFGLKESGELVTDGLYKLTRHPLYTYSLLLVWASPQMTANSLAIYIGVTLYILIGIIFEERKLARTFGDAYTNYRKVTPMLIPWLKFRE